uniref:Uncharacterized protein n=1 Tax=Anopheles merus TaxID=30066 RepID=A0A182VM07_ANOME
MERNQRSIVVSIKRSAITGLNLRRAGENDRAVLAGSSGGDTVGGTSRRIYILPAGILIPFTAFAQKVKNVTIAPGWAYGARWPESSAKGAEKVECAVAVAS